MLSSSPMSTNANAAKKLEKGTKKMSRGGGGWSITKGKNGGGGGESKKMMSITKGKNGGGGGSKKKMSISVSRSMACGSICSTKESSVFGRRSRGGDGGSASSRSLKAPGDGSSAAVSASSSFNSEATMATTVTTTGTTTASSSSSAISSPVSSSVGGSFRAASQMRKLSGCYECHSALDPRSLAAAAAMLPCPDCGEAFAKAESLELHRATMHAVMELGGEDTSRNIVEIIFQSSWLKKQGPVCKIERILKVQSSGKTARRFEQYKEHVRARATTGGDAGAGEGKKNHPRCVADGNELLRFHCTTFACSLGLAAGTTALCHRSTSPECSLCSIIRDGFRVDGGGRITTMATSGRAHDMALASASPDGGKRAMLVCRVVAGRVKKVADIAAASPEEVSDDCDSISSCSQGVYSDLDELVVFNPRAILLCFVVIYSGY